MQKITAIALFLLSGICLVVSHTKAQSAPINVFNATPLASTANNKEVARFGNNTGNISNLIIYYYRNTVGGTNWLTATTRVQAFTDVSSQAYIDFNPVNNPWGLSLGTSALGAALSINSSNYVTIGSVAATPVGYKLFVQSGILTEKVKVAVNGSAQWADYVFHKDYKLMPLTEVEKFVKANKHLPNVPSAADMVKEGNDLGKTDAKLLEKIEELTLYLIEMKKANEQLAKTVENQNKKIELLESKIK